jgi:hypothetical protein
MPQVQLILPEGPLAPLEFELGARPNLELLQKWVGGLIETVYFEDDPSGLWHIGYVNEEGLIHQLPRNRFAEKVFVRYPHLVGTCVVLEGLENPWWFDGNYKPVRAATKEEALHASQSGDDEITENGVALSIGTRGEDDEEG